VINNTEKQIKIFDQTIPYSIRESLRARRARISVTLDDGVVVTIPRGGSETGAKKFVEDKISWILKALNYLKKFKNRTVIKSSRKDYLVNKSAALVLAKTKVQQWNKFYGFSYSRVSIKNQKTRWGSCSKKGNLNFNYKIIYLPENLVDYLIVHELCHLKEMNHGRNFWQLVSQTIPDCKKLRYELRRIHHG
jgi:predicted metal-dependent hydrolase